ncbi:hypothetical protein L4C37_11400 [Vibrio kagoshimensis]|uniref:hypothetical protein n=1 Tax=Vibrio kagoshimensis TaxID=2910244 RepID=UPI003D1E3539
MTNKNQTEEEAKESTRSSDAIRQARMAKRRKKSGLIPKRLHLTSKDLSRLHAIATDVLGFEIPEGKELGLEDLSAIVGYCVAVTTSEHNLLKVSKPDSEEKLYRLKVKNIIRYRLKRERNRSNRYQKVVNFLIQSNYPVPTFTTSIKEYLPIPELNSEEWSELKIKALLGKN